MGTSYKDLFSVQASDYAKFRPNYSEDLFQYLSSLTHDHQHAWDVGTGNGQAASVLANYYEKVSATDPSEKQIASAIPKKNVFYRVGHAENSEHDDHSIDLVTVAQAFHWFKQDAFYKEINRVVKTQGILAIWSYGLANIDEKVDAEVLNLYSDILGTYWEPERKLVESGYRDVKIPFEEITPPNFKLHAEWSLQHLLGYLSTWSALQTYVKSHGKNPLEELAPRFAKAWGSTESKPVTWDLSLRVFRVNQV